MECHTRVEDRGVRANRNGNRVYSTTAEVLEVVARGQSSEAKGCGRMKNGGRIVGTVANRMSRGYEGEQDKQAYIYIYMFALLSVIIERFALHGKITGKFALQG